MGDKFIKSDVGAQSAWKGFSSQTLYIANRIIQDKGDYEYYPEDIEDLIIKKDNKIIEAVQIKNISSPLTLSSLASSDTSKRGEGFFNRMLSIYNNNQAFSNITIVYFESLGKEFELLKNNNLNTKTNLINKLVNNHKIPVQDATWLIESLKFEKVNLNDLEKKIKNQFCTYIPTMSSPLLAKELLIQYISRLSLNKGFLTLKQWEDKIHNIGVEISSIDGFYKEYNKSLIRIDELHLNNSIEELQNEFSQGVSTHPTHIRNNLDIKQDYWLEQIYYAIKNKNVAIVKGVSGQGKSALCYRYLFDNYPEGCIFCVRGISSEEQVQSLVTALNGLGKHNSNLIIYIDVQPGEILWAFLVHELQQRGLNVPILISIRNEDYNSTVFNGKDIKYELIELTLSKKEAELIYDLVTHEIPHSRYREFDEAWNAFGCDGPLIEFVYLLTNNQSLIERIHTQIESLIKEKVSDEWLELLMIVSYSGRLGISSNYVWVKEAINCSNMTAAIQRLKDEYLIRVVEQNKIEPLHPVRAKIIFDELCSQTYMKEKDIVFKTITCVPSNAIQILLMDYFTKQEYVKGDIYIISQNKFNDWISFASVIKTMLWLDVKRYVDANNEAIQSLIQKRGKAWLCYLPIDPSGIYRPNELIIDGMKENSIFENEEALQESIDEVKNSLKSLMIDYEATDYFLTNCNYPVVLPRTGIDNSSFGYSLYWMAKRNFSVDLKFTKEEIQEAVLIGEVQESADAIRGIYEHKNLYTFYKEIINVFISRLISEMNIIKFSEKDNEVTCKFIPPLENEIILADREKYSNQYWRTKMLNILKQIYPQKDYIDIELVGIDLLDEFGINPLDYKIHIHKDKRNDEWVSEINGWIKIRIDYSLRPKSWEEYVKEIDQVRIEINDLIEETIKLIDDIYKKGRYTQARYEKIRSKLKVFKNHTFAENHLPVSAVDLYCLYAEGHKKIPKDNFFTMRQLLSVEKYKNFRKYYNDTYTSIDNFYNQFSDILLARIRKQSLENIKNTKIAMFNLYNASKKLYNFQIEYNSLFSKFSSLDVTFAQKELENILTLVNVWSVVLDEVPKGIAIAYNAKQKVRKGKNIFDDLISEIINNIEAEVIETDEYIYIIVDYNQDENNSLEIEHLKLLLKLREIFKSVIKVSSDTWYCEKHGKEILYIPKICGEYSPSCFLIPFYKIVNAESLEMFKTMLPHKIEDKIKNKFFDVIWIDFMSKLQEIRIYLKRYSQIINVGADEICKDSLEKNIENIKNKINNLWNDFAKCEELLDNILIYNDEEKENFINIIRTFLTLHNEIIDCINKKENVEEIVKIIDTIFVIMLLLNSSVLNTRGKNI